MSELLAEIPASAFVPEGHYGACAGTPGVEARVVDALALATIVVRKDARVAAAELAQSSLGLTLPAGPHTASVDELTLIGTGPGRFLALAENTPGAALLTRLEAAFGKTVALTDQSDGQVVIELTGPGVCDALAKLVPLDLDPRAFKAGDAASTLVALVPVLLWQTNAAPTYRFAVPRSFAPAFLRALTTAGAEFGIALLGTGRG
ncbi:sarcosine oxidase subunit gamma family protein [Xanthobacter sp. DSM 24535]|uniref:sarcosine oxidase subunit gamma n=1 Tax=Roseixanthobacter psychrophilus TaxID=3119917 RepID=UPI00372A6056